MNKIKVKNFSFNVSTIVGFVVFLLGIFISISHNSMVDIYENSINRISEMHNLLCNGLILFGIIILSMGIIIASLQWKDTEIKITRRILFILSYLFLLVPSFVFFLGILKIWIGLIFSAILFFGFFWHVKHYLNDDEIVLTISVGSLVTIIFISLFWVMISGIGGFSTQRSDIHWRNVYLHDFSDYSWPLIYPQTGLTPVYYWAYFLFPSIFGKLFGFWGANIANFFWSTLGIVLTELLLCSYLKLKDTLHIFIAFAIFIFFGGFYLLGGATTFALGYSSFWNTGFGWADGVILGHQFTNPSGLLLWVYNQTIIAWLGTVLFLNEKKISSLAFVGLTIFPSGPYPFVGFFIFAVAWAIPQGLRYLREKNGKLLVKEIFSIPNLCSIFSIFFVFTVFFVSTPAINGETGIGLYYQKIIADIRFWIVYFFFGFVEYGFFSILIYKENKKDVLFWTMIGSLFFIPFIRVGPGRDFAMRASIPALLILYVLVLKTLFSNPKMNIRSVLLIIIISTASVSTISDWAFSVRLSKLTKTYPVLFDDIKTYSDKNVYGLFMANGFVKDLDASMFYKYLANRPSKKQYEKDCKFYYDSMSKRGAPLNEDLYTIKPYFALEKYLCVDDSKGKNELKIGADKQIFSLLECTAVFGDEKAFFDKYRIEVFEKELRLCADGKLNYLNQPSFDYNQKFHIKKCENGYKIIWEGKALTYNPSKDQISLETVSDSIYQIWKFERDNTSEYAERYARWLESENPENNYKFKNCFVINDWINEINSEKGRYTLFVATSANHDYYYNQQTIDILESLGIDLFKDSRSLDRYVAVIESDGTVINERSELEIDRVHIEGKSMEGIKYKLESGKNKIKQNYCCIVINNKDHAINSRGLNFVLYDNKMNEVVDSVCFDTSIPGYPSRR